MPGVERVEVTGCGVLTCETPWLGVDATLKLNITLRIRSVRVDIVQIAADLNVPAKRILRELQWRTDNPGDEVDRLEDVSSDDDHDDDDHGDDDNNDERSDDSVQEVAVLDGGKKRGASDEDEVVQVEEPSKKTRIMQDVQVPAAAPAAAPPAAAPAAAPTPASQPAPHLLPPEAASSTTPDTGRWSFWSSKRD